MNDDSEHKMTAGEILRRYEHQLYRFRRAQERGIIMSLKAQYDTAAEREMDLPGKFDSFIFRDASR